MLRVFSRPGYVLLSTVAALGVFAVFILAPAIPFALQLATNSGTLLQIGNLILGSITDAPLSTLAYVVAVSVLVGINTSLLIFYLRMYRAASNLTGVSTGILGVISAFLGFGCAACGSVFIAGFFSTASAGLLAALPFEGKEFAAAALALLLLSTYILVRAINKPPVCPI